jgi:hypothetical protein
MATNGATSGPGAAGTAIETAGAAGAAGAGGFGAATSAPRAPIMRNGIERRIVFLRGRTL